VRSHLGSPSSRFGREDHITDLLGRSREGAAAELGEAVFLGPGLLGHTKIESTVRYLGVDVEDAIHLAESTDV
jgi:hypothetical protein